MSSISGNSGYRDADTHLENPISSSTKCSDGSKLHPSFTGSEDAQESDGDDSGYIHQTVNEVYEKKETGKFVSGCLSLKSSDEEDEGLAAALQQMFSETTQVILIPAIKGSREKHGLSPRKLNVSWAEDVYDPPPSIMSHTRGKRQNQPKSKAKDNNHKKNGKKGHKGSSNSSSRGGKDKKQSSRKHGNGSGSRDKFQMRIAVACS
ncbi:PREDICTED: uncharacterized protein LOC104805432 isoform X2 [Tarenaya hassleriana]|uniref:uncharacterized protein LOC104805432 isoform X2 n=1 Tax=Tarenaya hassleriana TaxID=28532 RepID=UPI0008FD5779|nr:PREDICTED: uncharacterized protein LOC104805432 isoform X2 [Tarenaya hassleriana]